MEVESVDWSYSPIVIVRPSNAAGIFVTQFGSEARVGSELRLSGIEIKDAERLSEGEDGLLEDYVRPDPDRPGLYRLTGCRGMLRTGELNSAGCTDDLVGEYTPFVPES